MNNYAVETRRRSRSLLVVEGKHEKDELFWLVFKCFPEMNIDIDDVWIYGRIQKEDANENDLRKQFEQMDLSEILNVQNEVSRNFEKGFIWVLSTRVLLIPDYNFKLIK